MAGRHHWRAADGQPGRGKSQTGRSAEDLYVNVPPGTLVYDADASDPGGGRGELIDDLDADGKTVLVAEISRLAKGPVLVLAHRQELVEQALGRTDISATRETKVRAAVAEVLEASLPTLVDTITKRVLTKLNGAG